MGTQVTSGLVFMSTGHASAQAAWAFVEASKASDKAITMNRMNATPGLPWWP
jgi:hypothetical protein